MNARTIATFLISATFVALITPFSVSGCGGRTAISQQYRLVDGRPFPAPRVKRICLAPLGDFSTADASALAQWLGEKLGLPVEVLPPLPLLNAAFDFDKKQWEASALVSRLRTTYGELLSGAGTAIIGLTREDIFTRQELWQFVLAYSGGREVGVLSSYRMDPSSFGFRPNASLLRNRLCKMALRLSGEFVFGLTSSDSPDSVLYGVVQSLQDLDELGDSI